MHELLHSLTLPLAQAPAGGGNSVQVQSVWDFIVKGGPVMIPILACSLIALAVVVERLISLRRSLVIPNGFREELGRRLSGDGERVASALEYCGTIQCPFSRIFAAGVRRLGQPVSLIEKHIEEAGAREVRRLRRYLRLLAVIGAVAPLLGLLGTIFGMIEAFQTVAVSGEALGKTELLAKGIYEAMITTAAGLSLAIPVLVAHHGLSAKIDGLIGEMDELAADFIEEYAPAFHAKSLEVKSKVRGNGDAAAPESHADADNAAIVLDGVAAR